MKTNQTHKRYGRYGTVALFILFFMLASFCMRALLTGIAYPHSGLDLTDLFSVFLKGSLFDLTVALCFCAPYMLWLNAGKRLLSSPLGKFLSFLLLLLMSFVAVFSFFAEYTFWGEFESRFNFIAVDYLIYTYEVVSNINQSYPLPILLSCVTLAAIAVTLLHRRAVSEGARSSVTSKRRLIVTLSFFALTSLLLWATNNSWAEGSSNRYKSELSKAGIYSFVAAFRSNELDYGQFYPVIDDARAFETLKQLLERPGTSFTAAPASIERMVAGGSSELRPNVVMVVMESFSANFMKEFGNGQNLTPNLDSLAAQSLLFTNMYATGTRTVRGMEALSLAVPPTPGNSIVRRRDNEGLTTIGSIFRDKGYHTTFFYGGDGYFDNMNQYFGSNGYDIVDRGRRLTIGDSYTVRRTRIPDSAVRFENAWGVSDQDLYKAVIRSSDTLSTNRKPFYHFVMTTSNHRPFTYPAGSIDIPSGTGRDGAIKYTDHAIGEFIRNARTKPWFSNTVFIFIADHCASSAGKNEIDIAKYKIPAMVYNLKNSPPAKIAPLCSQIDLYPTLLGKLGWSYVDNTYGMDVLDSSYRPRALLGTYQKLALLQGDSLVVLSPKKKPEGFSYDFRTNEQTPAKLQKQLAEQAIAYYQSAYQLYKNGGLKLKK